LTVLTGLKQIRAGSVRKTIKKESEIGNKRTSFHDLFLNWQLFGFEEIIATTDETSRSILALRYMTKVTYPAVA
jgi:hypothetical protein